MIIPAANSADLGRVSDVALELDVRSVQSLAAAVSIALLDEPSTGVGGG